MIIISSRENFWSDHDVAENFSIRNIDLTTSDPGTPMDLASLLAQIQGRNVLLLIHGYRNREDDVRNAYNFIEQKMIAHELLGAGRPYDQILGYTWPGGMMHVSYALARKWAERSGTKHLRPLLAGMLGTAASVDVNTHSLGARVALYALIQGNLPIRNLQMLAAAVDDDSIEKDEKFFDATRGCQKVCVLHSENDPVLKFTYPLGDFDLALGYQGPEHKNKIIAHSPNVRVVNCSSRINEHSGYRKSDLVYQYYLSEFTSPDPNQYTEL